MRTRLISGSVSATCASMNCTSASGVICIYVYIATSVKRSDAQCDAPRQEAAGVGSAIPRERSADPRAEKRMRPFICECDL